MSKIFDALRKAESKKSGPLRNRREVRVRREDLEDAENTFLRGVDENFKRGLRNLRNSIDSELRNSDSRVIMFTSAVAGEGKTTIVAFLARMLALGEADRVLLVDCAVVNPEIHTLFGLENDKGILDYLSGTVPFEEVIRKVDEGVLDIVTTGTRRGAAIPSAEYIIMIQLISIHHGSICRETSRSCKDNKYYS